MNKAANIPEAVEEQVTSLREFARKNPEYVEKALIGGGVSSALAAVLGLATRGQGQSAGTGKLQEALQIGDLYSDTADSSEALRKLYKHSGEMADMALAATGAGAVGVPLLAMMAGRSRRGEAGDRLDESRDRLRSALARYHHMLRDETLSGSGVDRSELHRLAGSLGKEGAAKPAAKEAEAVAEVLSEGLSPAMQTMYGGLGASMGLGAFMGAHDLAANKSEGAVGLKKMREAIEKQQRMTGAPATADVGLTPEEMIAYEAIRRENSAPRGRKSTGRASESASAPVKVSADSADPALKDLLASV